MENPDDIPPDDVLIVSGLPRSGTSLMMRMLEAGGIPVVVDGVREADIDNPNGYYEFEIAKKTKQDASWLANAPGKTVKMVYQLLYDLPREGHRYRVVFMKRNMNEILASQKKMLARLGKPTDTVSDEQMSKMFQSQLAKFHAWIPTQPQFSLLIVDYNQMVADPSAQLDILIPFLNRPYPLNRDAMAAVVQPDLYRNRAL